MARARFFAAALMAAQAAPAAANNIMTAEHPPIAPRGWTLQIDDRPTYSESTTFVNRDGTGNRKLWQREHGLQWLTHESWIRGRFEIAFVDWPHGMRAIDVRSGALRWITRFPAWHAHPDDTGAWFVCDTNFPDIGLHRFAAAPTSDDARGAERLCCPRSSSVGAHWVKPFPYNDGPVKVYAPQHTHPHPRPSPDGSRVLYTSDVSGNAQLYEVMLDR